jgi:hypothetical protein
MADIPETWSHMKIHSVTQFCISLSLSLHSTISQKENLLDTE